MPETKFVVVLQTTCPDGEPWEQVISPPFLSEGLAAAWREDNQLPEHCRIRPICDDLRDWRALLSGPICRTLRSRWEAGDVSALFEAVQKHGFLGLPLPQWCWGSIHKAALKLSMYEVRDLNEAFGFATKGRGRLPDRNRQARFEWRVFMICVELKRKGHKTSPDMFDEAAGIASARLNIEIGKTTVEKFYYSVRSKIEAHLDQ